MINAYLKFQASEVVAKLLPVHDHVELMIDVIGEQHEHMGVFNVYEVRWFYNPLRNYLIDLKEIFQLCEYAFRHDGFIYVSTETAHRMEKLTIDDFNQDFKRYCDMLVHRWNERKKITEEARCAKEQELADSAVSSAFFIVFCFLILLFS